MGVGAFTNALAAADSATQRTQGRASPARPMETTLLSLQRTAGNAAVTRLVRDRSMLARCGGAGCSSRESCATRDLGADEELLGVGQNALNRAVAARTLERDASVERPPPARRCRQLQRVPVVGLPTFAPTYDPVAARAWTTRVPCTGLRDPAAIERCESDCTPYGSAISASLAWHTVAETIDAILEGSIPQATSGHTFCSPWMSIRRFTPISPGRGAPFPLDEPADSTGSVLTSMKDDAVHHPAAEDPIMTDIRDHHLAQLVAHPGVPVPLVDVGIPQDQRPGASPRWPGLNLAFNDGP